MVKLVPAIVIDGPSYCKVKGVSKILASILNAKYINANSILNKVFKKSSYYNRLATAEDRNFSYIEFLAEQVRKVPLVDIKINKELVSKVRLCKEPTVFCGGLLAGFVSDVIIKIWVTADFEYRVRNYAKLYSSQLSTADIKKHIYLKDNLDRDRFLRLYNIDLFTPANYNDILIKSNELNSRQIVGKIVSNSLFKSRIVHLFSYFKLGTEELTWRCRSCSFNYKGYAPKILCPKCGSMNLE